MTQILMVLTSHGQLGDTGKKTGFWLEEFAAPYYVFRDAGAQVTLASPAGGQPPLDPKSNEPDAQTEATRRFAQDPAAQQALAHTQRLDDVDVGVFDAVFYPGGHGPLWDLAEHPTSIALIEAAVHTDEPLGLVCHAPGALKNAKAPDGRPVVAGRRVTGFSNQEEAAVGLTGVVPFLLEDVFTQQGAHYEKGPDWQPYVVTDGQLVTGQNPASSEATARALLALLD